LTPTPSLPPRPTALRMQPEAIPLELKTGRRFVLWRWTWIESKKKWTKPPLQANGRPAKATDPSTWTTYEKALAVYLRGGFDGFGLVLTKKDGLTGIDLDDCCDPNTMVIESWAMAVVARFQTYAELSPSGTGIRIWLKGELPPAGRKKGQVEVYDDLRFLTITGHRLPDTTTAIEHRQYELLAFHREVFGEPKPAPDVRRDTEPISLEVPDEELLKRARAAKNGAEFAALFDSGDLSRHEGDHSRADLALCCSLCFWTNGNAEAIDRLFRRSALMRPKWDESHFGDGRTYGQATVTKAQGLVREGWRPAIVESSPRRSDRDGQGGHEAAPVIVCTDRGLHDLEGQQGMADDALRALVAANQEHPSIFERGRQLVRVGHSKAAPDDSGHPIIEALSRDALASELASCAWFVTVGARGRTQYITPPEGVVRAVHARATWDGLPSLAGVTETPVVRSDGTIVSQPGYDAATWLYYAPRSGFRLPAIPERPAAAAIGAAVELLDEAFCDFPFADAASRANAFGLLLTPFVRHLLGEGLVPMAVIDAPTPGTGKGLLLDLTSVISTGGIVPKRTPASTNDEWRKELLAAALEGASYFIVDNTADPLGSPALDSAITAGKVTGRILGQSRDAVVSVRWTWATTGNNISVRGDLARRCYWIRLVPDVADPSQRRDFRHPELLGWAREQRAELVAATLTLIRAWFAAGRPRSDVPAFGSFEGWSQVVGGILAHAGIDAFLGNLREFRQQTDRGQQEWEKFISAWWAVMGTESLSASELARRMRDDQDRLSTRYVPMRETLPARLTAAFERSHPPSYRAFAVALGTALTRAQGRWFGTDPMLRFESVEDPHRKASAWRVTAKAVGTNEQGVAGSLSARPNAVAGSAGSLSFDLTEAIAEKEANSAGSAGSAGSLTPRAGGGKLGGEAHASRARVRESAEKDPADPADPASEQDTVGEGDAGGSPPSPPTGDDWEVWRP
jgi:hypothetical protein